MVGGPKKSHHPSRLPIPHPEVPIKERVVPEPRNSLVTLTGMGSLDPLRRQIEDRKRKTEQIYNDPTLSYDEKRRRLITMWGPENARSIDETLAKLNRAS